MPAMKNLTRILLGLSLGTASILSAQTTSDSGATSGGHRGPPGGRGGPGRGGFPIIRALDADKNHELSAAEIAGAPTALLTLDTNQDGALSAEELRGGRPGGPPGRSRPGEAAKPADAPARARPVMPVMLALDANGDGALSAAEIANAATSLKALDANSDGKLTPDELRPLPPAQN